MGAPPIPPSDWRVSGGAASVNFTRDWMGFSPGSGSGALAGVQLQVATNRGMSQNVVTRTSKRVNGSIFQFEDILPLSVIGGLPTDRVYFARLRVRNGNFQSGTFVRVWTENTSVGRYSPWSSVKAVKLGQVPPEPPEIFTVNSFFGGQALAAWEGLDQPEAVLPVTGFYIQYSKQSDFSSGVTEVFSDINNTNRLFTGLDEGGTYYFRIRAENDDGIGNFSGTVSVEIVVSPFAPEFQIDSPGVRRPVFYSLTGHTAGFNEKGDYVPGIETEEDYEVRLNALVATDFSILQDEMYAKNVSGDTLYFVRDSERPDISSLNAIRFKTFLDGENFTLNWVGNPKFPTEYSGKEVSITVDYSAQELTVSSTYSVNSARDTDSNTVSLASVDLDAEIAVTIQYQRVEITDSENNVVEFEYDILASVCPSDDFTSPVHCLVAYETDATDAVTQRWVSSGNMRSLLTANDHRELSESNVIEWEKPRGYQVDASLPLFGPTSSINENVWLYLQDAAAATYGEIALVDNEIIIRKIGERVLDITDAVASPSLSPTSNFTGQKIIVSYTNARIRNQGLMYYSLDDDNRVLEVGPGEEVTTVVDSLGSPNYIQQPRNIDVSQFLIYVASGNQFPFSVYGITDQTGIPVVPAQWADYGGRVTVEISDEIPGSINVNMTGPREQIPGTTAPYSLAYASGPNNNLYGALAIVGSGVVDDVETVDILTGAPTDKTPRINSANIDNVFINTKEQAYDRGVWASDRATGPVITLSGSVPVSAIDGFGLTAGSLIQYRKNIYRVESAVVRNVIVDFSAVEHVVVDDFDTYWNNLNVTDHDFIWGDNDAQDQNIFPFRDPLAFVASGGDEEFYDNNYRYHKFEYDGTFNAFEDLTVDVFLVGGGGGGGDRAGGGGGYTTTGLNVAVSAGAHAVSVGLGGAVGEDGEGSSVLSFTAAGGKAGGADGGDGGSGGGSGADGSGCSSFYGGRGGSDGNDGGPAYGGGGRGTPGAGQNSTTAEFGETGRTIYAGGGSGSTCGTATTTPGSEFGGGGATAENGADGLGGGGGGADENDTTPGRGGSGIVIVRYKV